MWTSAGSAQAVLTLGEAQAVRVEVFDLLGRRVAALYSGTAEAGRHAWPVETARLGTGMYLVRAVAVSGAGDPLVLTQKLTVVR